MPINGSLKLNRLRSLGEPSPGGIAAIVFMLIRPDLPSCTLIKKRRRRERCPFAGNIDNIVMRLREKDAEAWSCKLKSASLQEPDLALAVSSWVLGRQKAKPRAAMLGGGSHYSLVGMAWVGRWEGKSREPAPIPTTKISCVPHFQVMNQNPSIKPLSNQNILIATSAHFLPAGWDQTEDELTCIQLSECRNLLLVPSTLSYVLFLHYSFPGVKNLKRQGSYGENFRESQKSGE